MKLDTLQRMMLVNQYEILSHLDPTSKSYYDERIEILRSGYEVFYDGFTAAYDSPMSVSESKFVLDVLDMYRAFEGFKHNNPKTTVFDKKFNAYFRGFDGNNETSYMGFVQFLIDVQKKYGEQLPYKDKTDDFNSHMPMADNYRKMLEVRSKLPNKFALSEADIEAILKAVE